MHYSSRQFIKGNSLTVRGTAVLSGASASVLGNTIETIILQNKVMEVKWKLRDEIGVIT